MKYLLVILLIFAFIPDATSQEAPAGSGEKKHNRQMKKAAREAEKLETAGLVDFMIASRQFVLEADQLIIKGAGHTVKPEVNFMIVDSLEVTFQFESEEYRGPDGLFRYAVVGTITEYEITRLGRNEQNYSIYIEIITSFGKRDINLNVNPRANATATVKSKSGSMRFSARGKQIDELNYRGKLVPLFESKLYKERPIYSK